MSIHLNGSDNGEITKRDLVDFEFEDRSWMHGGASESQRRADSLDHIQRIVRNGQGHRRAIQRIMQMYGQDQDGGLTELIVKRTLDVVSMELTAAFRKI
jgi:hypothetical protein